MCVCVLIIVIMYSSCEKEAIWSKKTKKQKQKKHCFSLKTVTENRVKRVMEKMKKKKILGLDEIGQDFLLLGAKIIAIPLTRIINNSIEYGEFPYEWALRLYPECTYPERYKPDIR